MALQRKDVFLCDYDQADTVTLYNSIELPPGWVSTSDGLITNYWHSMAHAQAGSGAEGTPDEGGRVTTYKWTDDYDGTEVTTSTDTPPSGWVTLQVGGAYRHFKDTANSVAWAAANP